MTMNVKRIVTANKTSSVTAARDIVAEMNSEEFAVLPGFQPREGHIYVRVRAISARINQNYDGFPSSELKRAYKTFLGKPCFVNHVNDDPNRRRGRVVASKYCEAGEDKYIDVFMEVNAKKFPLLAKEIIEAGIDAVSMGCSAERTICSFCGNTATGMFDMCEHVINHKGSKLRKMTASGPEDVLVYEECRDIGFFELSFVFDPADETALASKVLVANKQATKGLGDRVWCDMPGCRRWAIPGTEGHQEWVQANGEQRTYDYCCQGHRDQYESAYPDWLKASAVRNAYKRRAARQLNAYGETEAPQKVDTLRNEAEDEVEEFHQYVESPDFMSNPDLEKAQELDRREELPPEFQDVAPDEMPPAPGVPAGEVNPADLAPGMPTDGPPGDQQSTVPPGSPDDPQQAPPARVPKGENPDAPGDDPANPPARVPQGESSESPQATPARVPKQDASQAPPARVPREDSEDSQDDPRNLASPHRNEQSNTSRKGSTMSRDSLAQRGRVASRARVAEDKSRNDQGDREEEFITQTPPAEPVETGDGDKITNTEDNLVARRNEAKRRRAEKLQAEAKRLLAEAQGEVPDPQEVAAPDEREDLWEAPEETQPKDAAKHAYREFAAWVRKTQGRALRQARSRAELLRWAGQFAKTAGLDADAMYPIVKHEIAAHRKKADNDEGVSGEGKADADAVKEFIENPGDADDKDEPTKESSRRRRATKTRTAVELDVAAPDGRVDVERPTEDTTDEDAQQGQFDLDDYGDNAGDDIADPDLTTDQNWLPGEGRRSSVTKRASGLQAVRLAEAMITANLDDKKEGRWNLAKKFERMSSSHVANQIALLERVIEANGLDRRTAEKKTAGNRGVSRTKSTIPPNLMQATPQTREAAAEVGNPDSDMFL